MWDPYCCENTNMIGRWQKSLNSSYCSLSLAERSQRFLDDALFVDVMYDELTV